jgi:hypothetical protein
MTTQTEHNNENKNVHNDDNKNVHNDDNKMYIMMTIKIYVND